MSGVDERNNHGLERLFYQLHRRVSLLVLRYSSHQARTIIEHTILVCGVFAFCLVLICHRTFVYRGPTASAVTGATGSYSTGGLGGALLDRLLGSAPIGEGISGSILGAKGGTLPSRCIRGVQGFTEEFDVVNVAIGNEDMLESFAITLTDVPDVIGTDDVNLRDKECIADGDHGSCASGKETVAFEPLYSYSQTKGFLLLPIEAQKKHRIAVQNVVISRYDQSCFGEDFLQRVVFSFVDSYRILAMNWLLALNNGVGYILPKGGHIIDLKRYANEIYFLLPRRESKNHIAATETQTQQRRGRSFLRFKLSVLGASLFLFFVTTTLVAFTLRESQDRMLEFTFQLQEHVRRRAPIGHLIATHVIENMVFIPIMLGAMFFLIEFYGGDKFLAFIVLTLVWVCEVFAVILMRTKHGTTFFPKTFFLYFVLFHAYYFSCPFGFAYASLLSCVLFLLHSMLFFYNRYELPSVLAGTVPTASPERPLTNRMLNLPPPINTVLATDTSNAGGPGPTLLPRRPLNHGQNSLSLASMSSLGRGSTAGGSDLLFQNGDDNEGNDGDDSSYMYFMGGEVVMHRDRNTPPSIASAGTPEEQPDRSARSR